MILNTLYNISKMNFYNFFSIIESISSENKRAIKLGKLSQVFFNII